MSAQINTARQFLDKSNFTLVGCFTQTALSPVWKPTSTLNSTQAQGYPDCIKTIVNNSSNNSPIYLGLYQTDANGWVGNCVYANPSDLYAAADKPLIKHSTCVMDTNGIIIGSTGNSIAVYDLSQSATPTTLGTGAVPMKYRGCFDQSALSYNATPDDSMQYLARPLLPQGGSVPSFQGCIIAAKNDMLLNGTKYKYIASMKAANNRLQCFGADNIDPSAVQLASCAVTGMVPISTAPTSLETFVTGGANSVAVYENPYFAGPDTPSQNAITLGQSGQVIAGNPNPAISTPSPPPPMNRANPVPAVFPAVPGPTTSLPAVNPASNTSANSAANTSADPAADAAVAKFKADAAAKAAADAAAEAAAEAAADAAADANSSADPSADPSADSSAPPAASPTLMDQINSYKWYIVGAIVLLAVLMVVYFTVIKKD